MKQIKKLAVLGFTLLFSLSAWSQDFERSGLRFQLSGGGATVLGQASGFNETDINIPASVNYEEVDYPVTVIGGRAFNGDGLTSVTIPDSVTAFWPIAFANNALTSVTIPDSVATIGSYAFDKNQLTSVTIPDSVTVISFGAFRKNQLTSVIIGNSVTSIEGQAFRENQLTSVTIPASVEQIGEAAFANNKLVDESGSDIYTLTSVTFNGEYIPDFFSSDAFLFYRLNSFEGTFFIYEPNPNLATISACPSESWSDVKFPVAARFVSPISVEFDFVEVTQTAEACPFVDPVVLIDELSDYVAALNTSNGISNALDAKLGAVQGALSDLNENNDVAALNAMYAFCYNAQAQSGKQLDAADADALIAKADAIIAAIDPDAALCSE